MNAKITVAVILSITILAAAMAFSEGGRGLSEGRTVGKSASIFQQDVTPKQVADFLDLLISEVFVSCDQLKTATGVAVQAHHQGIQSWDSLLQQIAIRAEHSDCGFDVKSWYLTLATESAEPPLRSHAFLRLGWLELQDGQAKQAITRFQSCLDSLTTMKDGVMSQDFRISSLHGQANAMAKSGDVQAAATVHLQAVALSTAVNGLKSPTTTALLCNQARIFCEAKNYTAACGTFDSILETQPADPSDFDDYLLNSVRRYQTAQRVTNAKPDDGVVALEMAWASQRLWASPLIARVGWELVGARLKQGKAAQACDLAAHILDTLHDNTKTWTATIDPNLVPRVLKDLVEIKMSCVSTLQSFSLHHNKNYLNYAYMSWLEEAPDAESQIKITEQWNRDIQSADQAK